MSLATLLFPAPGRPAITTSTRTSSHPVPMVPAVASRGRRSRRNAADDLSDPTAEQSANDVALPHGLSARTPSPAASHGRRLCRLLVPTPLVPAAVNQDDAFADRGFGRRAAGWSAYHAVIRLEGPSGPQHVDSAVEALEAPVRDARSHPPLSKYFYRQSLALGCRCASQARDDRR